MTEEDFAYMREQVDAALYHFVEAYGYNADDFDYSNFNDLLDEVERGDI